MAEGGDGSSVGTLEDLLRQIELIPPGASQFQLWVPQDLTYEDEPLTSEAAMAVILDLLLARELFPDGYEQGLGGRTYRYVHEETGASPRPLEPASRAAHWSVRALRFIGIGPKQPRFQPGQLWRYRTRAGEEKSRLQVLRIDVDPTAGEIIHIAVFGVQIKRTPGDPAPISTIGHVPVARQALEGSTVALASAYADIPEFSEAYETWRAAFESGDAGVFSIPVAEIVDVMEATIRGGAA